MDGSLFLSFSKGRYLITFESPHTNAIVDSLKWNGIDSQRRVTKKTNHVRRRHMLQMQQNNTDIYDALKLAVYMCDDVCDKPVIMSDSN